MIEDKPIYNQQRMESESLGYTVLEHTRVQAAVTNGCRMREAIAAAVESLGKWPTQVKQIAAEPACAHTRKRVLLEIHSTQGCGLSDTHRRKLMETLEEPALPDNEKALCDFLSVHYRVFILDEAEQGETDLVQLQIGTGNAKPIHQYACRMLTVVRQDVVRQLDKMQETEMVQLSKSLGPAQWCWSGRRTVATGSAWTTRKLSARIDDLLDQNGGRKYFTISDLASDFGKSRFILTQRRRLITHTQLLWAYVSLGSCTPESAALCLSSRRTHKSPLFCFSTKGRPFCLGYDCIR